MIEYICGDVAGLRFDLTLRDSCLASWGKIMSVRPTIRAASLVDYPEIAQSLGLDPYKLMATVRLPRSCLRNPDIRISAEAVAELLQASASAAGVDDFALRLAQRRGLSNLGPLALIVREQPTVRKAIEVLIQYIALHSDALRPRLEEKDRVVTISRMLAGKRVRTRQALELSVAMFYRIIKTFLGDAWRPQEVCFMHSAPNDPEAHRRFFGTRVRFGWHYDGIVCRAADLEKSIPTSDPRMARYLKEYFDSILPSSPSEVSETVRELVWVMLKSGSCSADSVAKHLGVDRKTLNRRLANEGQSYSSVLDAVRRNMVTGFVESGQRPLIEIAGMLGFSGLSSFSRWFRNRFGRSASQWRELMSDPSSGYLA
jgi:AraC-like DNA-binding protein